MIWQIKKLGEVCDISIGKTPARGNKKFWDKKKETNNIWLSIRDLNNTDKKEVFDSREYISNAGADLSKKVQKGTLLASFKLTLGRLAFAGTDLYTNEAIVSLEIKNSKELDKVYLYYYLTFFDWDAETKGDVKVKGKTLNKAKLKEIKVFVPPLLEQRRIVKILDKVFEKVAKAKENTEKNLANAKELFESYLQGVFDNKGKDWEETTIGKTCNLITGGTPSRTKKEYFENGTINWLVSGDINKKEIKDCDGKITALGLKNSSTKYLPINSVMIALNGQGKTRGTVAMLRIKATCNQSLVSIYPRDDSKLLPELIFANLKGRYNEIRKLTGDTGNDRRGLNMPIIRNIKFSYPKSITEQKTIVKKLDTLSAETKKLEVIYTQKLSDLDELKKSVLKKAFDGRL